MTAARRPRGDGSIGKARPDGRIPATLDLGTVNGKRKRQTVYGKTRAEAGRKLAALKRQVERGALHPPQSRMSLHDYLAGWLERKRHEVRPNTWDCYERCLRLHVVPTLGSKTLAHLEPSDLERLYAQLRTTLSAGSVSTIAVALTAALNDAVVDKLIVASPHVRGRGPRRGHHEMRPLRRDEVPRLLAALDGDPLRPIYVVAIGTGMRQGEILALRWRDLDLAHGRLSVQRTVTPFGFGVPKSGHGRRIVLAPSVLAVLRERQPISAVAEDALVFHAPDGRPLRPDLLRTHLRRALEAASLPKIRFHDLRHTAATLMLETGVPLKQVSEMLGHSGPNITVAVYAHVTETMQDQAAAALENVLSGEVWPSVRQPTG